MSVSSPEESEVPTASDFLFDDLVENDLIDELPGDAVVVTLTLVANGPAERLDKWLAGQLPDRSHAEIQRWIEAGLVTSRGRGLKASHKVALGDEIAVVIPAAETYAVEPEPIPLDILYQDADLLVINKPAGMVVHPAAGNWHGTLVNAVLYHCPDLEGVGGAHRPGIVHRLDKDTSGVILVAKNDAAHRALQAQFQARTVRKTYWALVYGLLSPAAGRDRRADRPRSVRPEAHGGGAERGPAGGHTLRDTRFLPHSCDGRTSQLAGLPSPHRPHPSDTRPPGVRQAPHRRR